MRTKRIISSVADSKDTTRVILGVTGGIAAFKSINILRALKKRGFEVIVVPTSSALKIVGKKTFEALSSNPVYFDTFECGKGYSHIDLATWADLILIAPATANTIAKIASGIADNLLLTTLLASKSPIVLAPAMHTNMYLNDATQENINILRARGMKIIEPDVGELSHGDCGLGRLPDEDIIVQEALNVLTDKDFKNFNVLITAGGTKEYIDPVRFIANNSSGKQGFALADHLYSRGANVTVIAGSVEKTFLNRKYKIITVETAQQMHDEVCRQYDSSDMIIMCAAVADWKVENPSESKIKKDNNSNSMVLRLVKNPDILKEISEKNNSTGCEKIIVGFAAETGDSELIIKYAKEKIKRKKCDFIIVNPVGENIGFNSTNNTIYILSKDGRISDKFVGNKNYIAKIIIDYIFRV